MAPRIQPVESRISIGRAIAAFEKGPAAPGTEQVELQTLIPQQRIDPQEADDGHPRVFQPDPDYQIDWRPEKKGGGLAVPIPTGTGDPAAGTPTTEYRFATLNRADHGHVYETAQAQVAGRKPIMPAHLAVARAQAIAAGDLKQDSSLYEYLAGRTKRPTAAERETRGKVRVGAMAACEAPVEGRRKGRNPVVMVERTSKPATAVVRGTAPAHSQKSRKVSRAPKMSLCNPEDRLAPGGEPMMSGVLPNPDSVESPSSGDGPSDGLPASPPSTAAPLSLGTHSTGSASRDASYDTAPSSVDPSLGRNPRWSCPAAQGPAPHISGAATPTSDSAGPSTPTPAANRDSAAEARSVRSQASVRSVASRVRGKLAAGAGLAFQRMEEKVWG